MQMMETQGQNNQRLAIIQQEILGLSDDSEKDLGRREDLLDQQEALSILIERTAARIKRNAMDLQLKNPRAAAQLRATRENKYLDLKLRARALKQRLRQRLINRRFEQERLERSYRSARLGELSLVNWVFLFDIL